MTHFWRLYVWCLMPLAFSRQACFTYFVVMRGTELFKVGKSINPAERLKGLQTGSPFDLELVYVIPDDVESRLHTALSPCLVRNEWFRYELKTFPIIYSFNPEWARALDEAFPEVGLF